MKIFSCGFYLEFIIRDTILSCFRNMPAIPSTPRPSTSFRAKRSEVEESIQSHHSTVHAKYDIPYTKYKQIFSCNSPLHKI